MAFTNSNFPNFNGIFFPDNGLKELGFLGKIFSNCRINRFSAKFIEQPSFYISRDSWDLLIGGKQLISNGTTTVTKNWLPPNYEVYAFVFCIAINTDENKNAAFFRIRTIIKHVKTTSTVDKIKVEVEENSIAYVDINIGRRNKGKSPEFQEDTIVFIEKNNSALINQINSDVLEKDKNHRGLPPSFRGGVQKGFNQNEGSIFAKSRILELLDRYPTKGSLVSFTYGKDGIGYDFKINAQLNTRVPCPNPPVCGPPPVA